MFARLSAFVIWSLVAATAVFWALRFGVQAPRAPAYAVPIDRATPLRGDLARLFGAPVAVAMQPEALPEAPSRFRLVGVMAPKSTSAEGSGRYGLALIAVDGKPARAFAVGSRLDSQLVLQSVGLRTASLGPAEGSRSFLLEMPPLNAAATGALPVPGSQTALPARPLPVPAAAPAPTIGSAPGPATQPQTTPPAAAPNPPINPGLPAADNIRSQ
jgi:general secretion pathway protein C